MNPFYLLRNEDEGISEAMLEYMMGTNVDAEKIFITKTNSFQWVGDFIMSLEAKHDETCFLTNHKKSYLEQVNKNGEKQNNSVKLLLISVLQITMKFILVICLTIQSHICLCPLQNL